MGVFDFLKGKGRKVDEGDKAREIHKLIQDRLGDQLKDIHVEYSDGTVRLSGTAMWYATRQKAVLLAGNVQGVEKVDDDGIVVDKSHVEKAAAPEAKGEDEEAEFYTIQKGDTLSGIAKREYGDANAWRRLFEANREVVEDANKIYPGQVIRVPKG